MTLKTYIAGHAGLVGSALVRLYEKDAGRVLSTRRRAELDLTDPAAVDRFFSSERPDEVLLAAAKVGGIQANRDFPVDFLLDNLRIQNNVLSAAHRFGVKKLLFLGSSCIYPPDALQPIREDALLTGKLEPTNEPYALAKIAGVKLVEAYRQQHGCNFIAVMPTNLYGPGDNFALASAHVIPAMLRRFHDARISRAAEVTLWGTGNARREFLHVDDCAVACKLLMDRWVSGDIVNIGSGAEVTIRELADTIAAIAGYSGDIRWDTSKPDGPPRKLLDGSRLRELGWCPAIELEDGLRRTYAWFVESRARWRRM